MGPLAGGQAHFTASGDDTTGFIYRERGTVPLNPFARDHDSFLHNSDAVAAPTAGYYSVSFDKEGVTAPLWPVDPGDLIELHFGGLAGNIWIPIGLVHTKSSCGSYFSSWGIFNFGGVGLMVGFGAVTATFDQQELEYEEH